MIVVVKVVNNLQYYLMTIIKWGNKDLMLNQSADTL